MKLVIEIDDYRYKEICEDWSNPYYDDAGRLVDRV